MWNTVFKILFEALPILLSLASLIVHFFVFHRLKCTKNLSDCVKQCLPDLLESKQKSSGKPSEKLPSDMTLQDLIEALKERGLWR